MTVLLVMAAAAVGAPLRYIVVLVLPASVLFLRRGLLARRVPRRDRRAMGLAECSRR